MDSILKITFVLMVIGTVAQCIKLEKVELAIHEGNANFKEKIFVDGSGKYEIIKVPQHNNLSAIEIFIDYQKGVRIEKVVNEKKCLVMSLDKTKEKPMDLVNGVKHVHNKFLTSSYMVVHESILTTGKVDLKSQIGKTASLFCGAGMDIEHAVAYVGDDMNGFAKQLLANFAEKKNKKRGIESQDTIEARGDYRCCSDMCAKGSKQNMADVLMKCNGQMKNIKASCEINTNPMGCVYRVLCPYNSNTGQWTCKSLHQFNSFVCCDYKCNK